MVEQFAGQGNLDSERWFVSNLRGPDCLYRLLNGRLSLIMPTNLRGAEGSSRTTSLDPYLDPPRIVASILGSMLVATTSLSGMCASPNQERKARSGVKRLTRPSMKLVAARVKLIWQSLDLLGFPGFSSQTQTRALGPPGPAPKDSRRHANVPALQAKVLFSLQCRSYIIQDARVRDWCYGSGFEGAMSTNYQDGSGRFGTQD
ncbi:hypothetical protein BJX65DRAFT_169912 [Aspergillus insuetus]